MNPRHLPRCTALPASLGRPVDLVGRFGHLALAPREWLVAVGLDARQIEIAVVRRAGDQRRVACSPPDLLRPLVAAGATAVAIVHNHPSGSPEPSGADRVFTARMAAACALAGVALADHVIVAAGGWVSFAARGWLYGGRR